MLAISRIIRSFAEKLGGVRSVGYLLDLFNYNKVTSDG